MPVLPDLEISAKKHPLTPSSETEPTSKPVNPTPKSAEPPKESTGYFKALSEQGQATAKATEEAKKTFDEATMKMQPAPYKAPPPPDFSNQNPIMQWGSLAMIGLMLGSGRSKHHTRAAMRAATGMLQAMKAGNLEEQKHQMEVWKTQSENAWRESTALNNNYKTLLDAAKTKGDLAVQAGMAKDAELSAKVKAVAAAAQDPAMMMAADHGLPAMVQLQQQREQWDHKIKEDQIRGYRGALIDQHMAAFAQEHPEIKPGSPEWANELMSAEDKFEGQGNRNRILPTTPEQREGLIKSWHEDHTKWPNPDSRVMAQDPGLKEAWLEYRRRYPEDKPQDKMIVDKQVTNLASGKDSQNLQAFGTLAHHIDMLQELSKGLPPRMGVKALDQLAMKMGEQFQNPDILKWNTAHDIVTDELVKAVTNAGGVADREKFSQLVGSWMNDVALNGEEAQTGAFDVLKGLVRGRFQTMVDRYRDLPQVYKNEFFPPDLMETYGVKMRDKAPPSATAKSTTEPAAASGSAEKAEAGAMPEGKPTDWAELNGEPTVYVNGKWYFEKTKKLVPGQ